MAKLSKKNQEWLLEKFGERANFNPVERLLYSHDIAAMPGLFKPLIGNTIPYVVVQPQNEEELVELIQWAHEHRIPLTPRGKGSSGYGGIIPTRNGIVVHFHRQRRRESHYPTRHHLGAARQKTQSRGIDHPALSHKLSFLFGWRMACPRRRWPRFLRVRMVCRKRGERQSCASQW